MKIYKSVLTALIPAFLLAGCYKDIGNYDYTAINTVEIETTSPETISLLQFDTLRINIDLKETMTAPEGYSYSWTFYEDKSAPLTRRILGTGQDLEAKITEAAGPYKLDLFVTDNHTQVGVAKRFNVNVTGKYNEGWVVLDEKAGVPELSIINANGTTYNSIYADANGGEPLPAGSFRVNVVRDRLGALKVLVMNPTGGLQLNAADFLKVAGLDDWYWAPPDDRKPQNYFIHSSDEVLINNGKPYGLTTLVPAPYKFGLAPYGDYTVAPYDLYYATSGYVFYNETTQGFTKLSIPSTFVSFAAPPDNAPFDMRNIGKKLLFAGINTGAQHMCLFKNNTDDSTFVYMMDLSISSTASLTPAVSKTFIEAGDAPGILTASSFVPSRLLPHLYYTSGESIYLLDIPAAKARKIYSFPAGTQVMASEMYYNSKNSSDPDNYRLIAVATQEAGEGKVYFFPIDATGDFTGNTYRNVVTGFGHIKDIEFKRAP